MSVLAMLKALKLTASDESGATLAEYGMALIVTIIVGAAAITALGGEVNDAIQATASAF